MAEERRQVQDLYDSEKGSKRSAYFTDDFKTLLFFNKYRAKNDFNINLSSGEGNVFTCMLL